jgi:nicotinate phosphoribosyltransferase
MAHENELLAFRNFGQSHGQDCVLLVDTYNAQNGIANAITVAKEMEGRGDRLFAIRIDSGDLAWLSRRARQLLDEAGLDYVRIIASNDLDEYTIQSLRDQGAAIDSWGVGTRLVTAYETPALSAVYKLSAVRDSCDAAWTPTLKVSEQLEKSTLPGLLDVRRYYDQNGLAAGDMIYQMDQPVLEELIIDPQDELRRKQFTGCYEPLLKAMTRQGLVVWPRTSVMEARQATLDNLSKLDASTQRFLNPHRYPVGLSAELHNLRDNMRRKLKGL